MSKRKNSNERIFKDWTITYRNPNSIHIFHKQEGITKKLIEDILKNAIEKDISEDPRKLRKKIRLFHITKLITEHIRITILFQIFPAEKRLHVINAYLGSFHRKNLFEKIGLEGRFNGN